MKNLRIRKKLILGFLIVAVFTAVAGTVGVVGMQQLENDSQRLNTCMVNTNTIAMLMENLQQQRVLYRDAILQRDDPARQKEIQAAMDELIMEADQRADFLRENMMNEESLALWKKMEMEYTQEYSPMRDALMAAAVGGNDAEAIGLLDSIGVVAGQIVQEIQELDTLSVEISGATSIEATRTANLMTTIMVAASVAIVVLGILLGMYFSGLIAKPVGKLVEVAKMLMDGDVEVDVEIAQQDEVGDLGKAFAELIDEIKAQSVMLQSVAEGDYTINVPVRSPRDVMNQAIGRLAQNGNNAMTELKTASSHMFAAAGQISQSSHSLASGSALQAASIEDFTHEIKFLQEKTKRNAAEAKHMQEFSDLAGSQMNESVEAMRRALDAINNIGDSANKLTKVIGVIDDMAFQTNILSINAAVEAAHAGEAGKGFAVVAEEVRMLAAKSASAARECANLIEDSVMAVTEGSKLVRHAGEQIDRAAANSKDAVGSVNSMTAATSDQAESLDKLGESIESISDVVQANSATAQQVAAAAEELTSQAGALDSIIARYKIRETVMSATLEEKARKSDNVVPLYNGNFSLTSSNI